MVSIPPAYDPVQAQEFQNRIAILETENRQLQAENRTVKAAFNRSQLENHKLKQQLEWEKRLFANPAYSFSEKFTIWAGKPLIEASKPNEQGMYHIPLYKVAPAIGASPKTVGRNFLKLSEATTDVKRSADRNETESGAWQTDVYIAFSEQLLTRPDQPTRLHPRNQGGWRTKRCQDCGSDNLAEQKMIICLDCGCEQSKTLRPVNSTNDLADCRDEQEDDREPTDGQVDHRDITPDACHVHDDDVHDAHDTHNGNVTHDTPINIIQPEDNLSSLKKQKESLDNLSTGEEKPPTPPVYPPTEYTPTRDHNDDDDHHNDHHDDDHQDDHDGNCVPGTPISNDLPKSTEHGGVDEYHRRKYDKHEMRVEWPTEAYLIDHFNEQHTIDEHIAGGAVGFSEAGEKEKQGTRLPWQAEEQEREQGIPEAFTVDTPCEQCGCALHRDMLGSWVCVRCYPPRGYHNYRDLIDTRYPRRKRLEL